MRFFEFGSRSGSFFAIALFGTLFGAMGLAAALGIRQRIRGVRRVTAAALGLALFVLPVSLIYTSSLGGFYEVEVQEGRLALRYLLPQCATVLPIAEIGEVSAAPAFRGRWRLHIVTRDGRRYESATWHSGPVIEAANCLRMLRQGNTR